MAIYDFPKEAKGGLKTSVAFSESPTIETKGSIDSGMDAVAEEMPSKKDQIFSGIATRLFFLLLVAADLLWVCYAIVQMSVCAFGYLVTAGRVNGFKTFSEKAWVALRRSLVCGVSLIVALFSPSFGIMIACTYFLMYDKTGIEEVVPSSLQSQFREFLPKS